MRSKNSSRFINNCRNNAAQRSPSGLPANGCRFSGEAASPEKSGKERIGNMRITHVFRCRYRGIILGLLAAALVIGSAGAQTSVKFTLDWKFEGPAAPFLVAVDRGYFTAEKLEVTIEPGNGSLEPINRVASGAYDIGFGDINTLIKIGRASCRERV